MICFTTLLLFYHTESDSRAELERMKTQFNICFDSLFVSNSKIYDRKNQDRKMSMSFHSLMQHEPDADIPISDFELINPY